MSRSNERGLGRGLGALIPRATVGLREVPVEAIRPNPWQPRTHFDEQELEELAQSIREHGVLQPVLVSQQPDGSFQLITGERRWRAVQLAGLPTVPELHPLQQAMIDEQAAQCGYCYNGMIVKGAELLSKTPRPTEAQIRTAMDGHLCRCGTYPQILKAIQRAAVMMAETKR